MKGSFHNLILMVDTSSVMQSKPNVMQSALQTLMESADPASLITLITYDNRPKKRCTKIGINEATPFFRCDEGGMSNCHAALNEAAKAVKALSEEKVIVMLIAACQSTDPLSNLSQKAKKILESVPLVFLRADKSIRPPEGVNIGNAMTFNLGTEECTNRLSDILRKTATDDEEPDSVPQPPIDDDATLNHNNNLQFENFD